jgi:cytosine deaminase
MTSEVMPPPMLIRNATLPDGRTGIDLLVQQGRIAAVGPAARRPEGVTVIDAEGWLLSPPFVDAHFHMDATLSYGLPRVNASGTLLEGIALWGELKPQLTQEALVERALRTATGRWRRACWRSARTSTCATTGCWRSRRCCTSSSGRAYLDLQLVAFPQDGVLRSPNGAGQPEARARPGRRRGRRHPALRAHHGRGRRVGAMLCELAAERGLRVDMHCDESDDPLSRHIETLAFHTQRLGLQGRVTGSHLTSMHSMDNYYVSPSCCR